MIKKLLAFLLLFSALFFFNCLELLPFFQSKKTYRKISLEEAYRTSDKNLLDSFFIYYKNEYPPISKDFLNKTDKEYKEIYAIFKEFYSPLDLNRLTNGNHKNYKKPFKYIVVQGQINYGITDTLPEFYHSENRIIKRAKLGDFRPEINNLHDPYVFLTNDLKTEIDTFLNNPDSSSRFDGAKRYTFLNEYIELTHRHWGPGFHIETMPVVLSIYMDSTINYAVVRFRVYYQFGEAKLNKINGKWELISSMLNGIE